MLGLSVLTAGSVPAPWLERLLPVGSSTPSFVLDGIGLGYSGYLPSGSFSSPQPGDAIQIATSSLPNLYREVSVLAIPYGGRTRFDVSLGTAVSGGRQSIAARIQQARADEHDIITAAPTASIFGRPTAGIWSHARRPVHGGSPIAVSFQEWVGEDLGHLWVIRIAWEERPGVGPRPGQAPVLVDTGRRATGALDGRLVAAPLPLPAPGWWNGETCDKTYWWNGDSSHAGAAAQGWTGAGAHALGAVWQGLQACGPRPLSSLDNAPDVVRSFGGGAALEWECVELSMRWMNLEFGITPYHLNSGNASTIVDEYPGSLLTKVSNGSGVLPQPGDILQYTIGHTSVVTGMSVDSTGTGTVTVEEQNNSANGWNTISASNHQLVNTSVNRWLHGTLGSTAPPRRNADLFLYNQSSGSSYVELANNSGGWSGVAGPSFSPGWNVYPGTFDRSSLDGAFLYNPSSGASYVEIANGSGGWSGIPGPSFSPGWTVYTGDFNGDGLTDLFLYNASNGASYVEIANGSGGWSSVPGPTFSTGWTFFVGNFDHSSRSDLFLYNPTSGTSYVELADGSGGWTGVPGPPFSTGWTISVGRFDRSGMSSLFLYNPSTGASYVEFPDGSGNWSGVTGPAFSPGWSVYTGDFSGGGLTDLFLYNPSSGASYVEFASGSGTWSSVPGPAFSTGWSFSVGDYDASGSADLFLYNPTSGASYVELANGSGGWTSIPGPAFSTGWSVYVGQYDQT